MDRNGLPRTRVKSKTCIPILKCAAGYDRLNPRVGFGLGIGIDFLEIRTGPAMAVTTLPDSPIKRLSVSSDQASSPTARVGGVAVVV